MYDMRMFYVCSKKSAKTMHTTKIPANTDKQLRQRKAIKNAAYEMKGEESTDVSYKLRDF